MIKTNLPNETIEKIIARYGEQLREVLYLVNETNKKFSEIVFQAKNRYPSQLYLLYLTVRLAKMGDIILETIDIIKKDKQQ